MAHTLSSCTCVERLQHLFSKPLNCICQEGRSYLCQLLCISIVQVMGNVWREVSGKEKNYLEGIIFMTDRWKNLFDLLIKLTIKCEYLENK